jgi:hypothetical protein
LKGFQVKTVAANISESLYWSDAFSNETAIVYRLDAVKIVLSIGRCTDMSVQ